MQDQKRRPRKRETTYTLLAQHTNPTLVPSPKVAKRSDYYKTTSGKSAHQRVTLTLPSTQTSKNRRQRTPTKIRLSRCPQLHTSRNTQNRHPATQIRGNPKESCPQPNAQPNRNTRQDQKTTARWGHLPYGRSSPPCWMNPRGKTARAKTRAQPTWRGPQ
jgi:hypothetical protein